MKLQAVARDGPYASRFQVPLVLVWAVTVHRCQGLTMDAAVMDLAPYFLAGMVYVALSRVRAMSGVFALSFNRDRVYADCRVTWFYADQSDLHGTFVECDVGRPPCGCPFVRRVRRSAHCRSSLFVFGSVCALLSFNLAEILLLLVHTHAAIITNILRMMPEKDHNAGARRKQKKTAPTKHKNKEEAQAKHVLGSLPETSRGRTHAVCRLITPWSTRFCAIFRNSSGADGDGGRGGGGKGRCGDGGG